MSDDIRDNRDLRDLIIEGNSNLKNLTLEVHDMKSSIQRQWEALDREKDVNAKQDVLLERASTAASEAKAAIIEHKADHWKFAALVVGAGAGIMKFVQWASGK